MKENVLKEIDRKIEANRNAAAEITGKSVWLNGNRPETFKIQFKTATDLNVETLEQVLAFAKTNAELLELRILSEKHFSASVGK